MSLRRFDVKKVQGIENMQHIKELCYQVICEICQLEQFFQLSVVKPRPK